jgi:hypothetical protein
MLHVGKKFRVLTACGTPVVIDAGTGASKSHPKIASFDFVSNFSKSKR